MSKNLLLTIVLSFVVFDHVQTEVVDDTFTIDQFAGRWYHMGNISPCEGTLAQQCMTHDTRRLIGYGDNYFTYTSTPIHNISGCEYGHPIYTYAVVGDFDGSTINFHGDLPPHMPRGISSTVKKYNNGTELIFTDSPNRECNSTTYRLWSRVPKVSAEAKAAFEKLATHGAVKYEDWDRCPKLRNDIEYEPTPKQMEGLWYVIAKTYYGDIDNSTCATYSFNMDYENRTFDLIETTVRGRTIFPTISKGIFDPRLTLRYPIGNHGRMATYPISALSCNNGTDLIYRISSTPNQKLLSRNSEVSAETMLAFKKLSTFYRDINYKIFQQKGCPNPADYLR